MRGGFLPVAYPLVLISAIFALFRLSLAQTLESAASCPPPFDIKCFIDTAQFTILGTVVSNTINSTESSPTNYTATISVGCVYYVASLDSKQALTSPTITVTGWGKPNTRCAVNGLGADATPGETKIMFLYVQSAGRGGAAPIYSVFDVCQGGFPNTTQYLTAVAEMQNKNKDNVVNLGSQCQLPALPSPTITSPAASSPPTASPSSILPSSAVNTSVLGFGSVIALFCLVLQLLM